MSAGSSMVFGDSNKTTMKASHRAFRSNKAPGIMSSSSLLLKSIRKGSKFVRVNKGLLATSILLTGSFHAYKSHIREDLSLDENVSQQTVHTSLSIRERIQQFKDQKINFYCSDLLERGPVFYVWGQFWFRTFANPFIHDSLLHLLYGAIFEDSFVKESSVFGEKWIAHCI